MAPKPALSPKQELAALALAQGLTIKEAAGKCGAGERTVKRWLEDPAFAKRITDLRGQMTSRALGVLADGMVYAGATLRSLLTAKSETVRLGAARAIIEMTSTLRKTTELEERLAALEQRAKPR